MKISDVVANLIQNMIDEENGIAEIQRNELASQVGCVPSQINYVITSRFTPENGYIVESRRGGGGYVRIIKVKLTAGDIKMHIINSVGEEIDEASVKAMIGNLYGQGIIDRNSARLIWTACCDKALRMCEAKLKNFVRADIFKQMLLASIERGESEYAL